MQAATWHVLGGCLFLTCFYILIQLRLGSNMFRQRVGHLLNQAGYGWVMSLCSKGGFGQSFCCQVCLYITGFPCTTFSSLHWNTSLLGDVNSKQLFKTIRNIRQMRPFDTCLGIVCMHSLLATFGRTELGTQTQVCILENVMGFRRVLDHVLNLIHRNVPGLLFLQIERSWKIQVLMNRSSC